MKNILPLLLLFIFNYTSYAQYKEPKNCSIAEIDSLLEVFKTKRAYDKFIPYATIGAQKAKKVYGDQDTTYAKMLYFLGFGYNVQRDFINAEKHLKEAIDIQRIKTPTSLEYARNLNNLAILYLNMGDYTLAEPLFKEATNTYKKTLGEKSPKYAKSLNNLGYFYLNTGSYAIAEPLFKEAMNIRKEVLGKKHAHYASSLNDLANLYSKTGSYALAEPLYKEAINIRKEVLGKNNAHYASSLNDLANLYNKTNRYALAEPLYKEAINIRKEVLGKNKPVYANSLNNLAGLYNRMDSLVLAEPLYKEAMNIYKEVLGEKHPHYASSLNNLAGLYSKMAAYSMAESLYKEAMNIYKEALGEKHSNYLNSLNNLANLYKDLNEYDTSWSYIQKALITNSGQNISSNISKPWADSLVQSEYSSREQMQTTLHVIYDILVKDNIPNYSTKQRIVSELAMELLKNQRNDFSDEADKLRTLVKSNEWVLRGLAVSDKKTQLEKAFAFAEQSKSVLLLDAALTKQAYSFGYLPDSLIQKEKELQQKRTKYHAAILEVHSKTEKDSLVALLGKTKVEIKDFKALIETSFPKYAALKYKNKDAQTNEVQLLLDDKTALLEYVIGDSILYIFYLDKKQLLLFEKPIPNSILKNSIKMLHRALNDYELIKNSPDKAYQDFTKNASWCYENLLKEPLSKAQGISQLIIIPDGELAHLPFETFLVEKALSGQDYSNLHYLLKDYTISYNYSATLWKENLEQKQPKNNGQMLAMAAHYGVQVNSSHSESRLPVYDRLRQALNALPAARIEVEALEKAYAGFFGFDNLASEKTFKEKAARYAVIHLAMHGFLDKKNPILSSLAFTEDGDSLENNFLQAYEISKMELNADLVVLSACETGFGKFEKGNGTASLARAFMYAGASALVVSLWQVNDASTSLIMQNFYSNLAKGFPKDKALQQAKLAYLEKINGFAAHPAFWSPFVLIGNSNPIGIQQKSGSKWLWIILGSSIFLIIGVGFAIRRKKRL